MTLTLTLLNKRFSYTVFTIFVEYAHTSSHIADEKQMFAIEKWISV